MTPQETFQRDGHLWLRGALTADDVAALRALASEDARPGARIAATDPLFQEIENSRLTKQIAALWPGQSPVRVVSFNKTEETNWAVPWHQDRVIAVRDKADVAGFGTWSRKGDVWHCEPPEAVLQQMLFVRLHLDPSTAENGAMEIAPGSHRHGIVAAGDVARLAETLTPHVTTAAPGDVLVLHMLTAHRSGSAQVASARATLRIDFAAAKLPAPLRWAL